MGFLFDDPRNGMAEKHWIQLLVMLIESSIVQNDGLASRGVHACLPSILKSLAKIDFTLQALKLVLGCLGLFPSSGGELGCLDTLMKALSSF